MARPVVAIVGRPNVGKSTLFNKLIGERRAVMHDVPGTTRDRLYGMTDWGGREMTVVDTGGIGVETELLTGPGDPARWGSLPLSHILAQAQEAMEEADVIVFLVDALNGISGADQDVANLLRRSKKPIVLGANKAEGKRGTQNTVELYELGLGEPIPFSAIHGTGTGELLDAIVDHLPPTPETEEAEPDLSVAIVGRPNVGKSSILNRLLGKERAIVSPIPGTTRDALDTEMRWQGKTVRLIDTAGIRRRGRIEQGVEKFSVLRAVRAIERAEVAILVLDATSGVTAQDTHVAGYIQEAKKGLVIAVNKWDLLEKDNSTVPEYTTQIRRDLNFVDWAPIVFVSALTGQRAPRVLDLAYAAQQERDRRVTTPKLIEMVREAVQRHQRSEAGRQLKIYYSTQADVRPPTFVFFVNDPKLVHFTYQRYLENQIRQSFGFQGTAIRLIFRGREERA
ncbi:MAG TPA: ribosome biogenesis GTPase Der [Chloroflexota bacterium]|nr:ribosome biogenesis GTPase Der [Chloroflexota bacterium]